MTDNAPHYLVRQFETAWKLTIFHLDGLTTAECLWRPAHSGLHVHLSADGTWDADWPTHERYDLGPPSIAWLTWHLCFWWSMVMDHSFGDVVAWVNMELTKNAAEIGYARCLYAVSIT